VDKLQENAVFLIEKQEAQALGENEPRRLLKTRHNKTRPFRGSRSHACSLQ
jgi:hypothetical protein